MLSINDNIDTLIDGIKILDNRTVNALNNNADIFTLLDLLKFCSVTHYDKMLLTIKGMGDNGVFLVKRILIKLQKEGITLSNYESELLDKKVIDPNIYITNLNLYSSYLSLRTINSLNLAGIITVKDLFENKNIYIKGIRGMGKKGIKEIDLFIKYIYLNFSDNNLDIEDQNISNLIKDDRLINILSFNGIVKISDLGKYIENKDLLVKLRYLNNEDYLILEEVYKNSGIKIQKNKNFAESFINMLNNLSEEDNFILNERILGKKILAEVGENLGITRERVRQKQKYIVEIISNNSNLFINQNKDILHKILNVIKIHKFIFLPSDIIFFDFLGFNEKQVKLLYLFLSGIEGVKGDIINSKNYCIYAFDIKLNIKDIINISDFVNKQLEKNNEDLSLDEFYYSLFVEKIIKNNEGLKDDIIALIKKNIENNKDYLIEGDIIHRFNKNYSFVEQLTLLMVKYPDGLHYSDIQKKLKEIYNIDKSEGYVHNVLGRGGGSNSFINIGLGIYTLKSNSQYSGEKTGDIIYLFLRNKGEAKSFEDISKYVLSRKKVNESTVRAVFDYHNENRFVNYNNSTIGLKEWNLGNIREKKGTGIYERSVGEGFDILKKQNLIPNTFSINDIRKIFINNFGNKVSSNRNSLRVFLISEIEKLNIGILKKGGLSKGNETIYYLIK